MDTDYLQCTVGEALAQGLAEVAIKKPVDPIEYLGSWLLRYKANTESASAVSMLQHLLLLITSLQCIFFAVHVHRPKLNLINS